MRMLQAAVALLATAAFSAGCAADSGTPQPPTAKPEATASATAPASTGASADLNDPCKLLTEAEVTKTIGAAPAPQSKSYGSGFSECVWKGANDKTIRLSIVPSSDLKEDYIAKLNKIGTAPALGENGTVFPGVLGIGHTSRGGVSVGFTSGEHGVLLAVRTGADQSADQATATLLGAALSKRL